MNKISRYWRLSIPEDYEIEGASSEHRQKRFNECSPIETKDKILALVSDTMDKEYPIFRDGGGKDSITTVTVGMR